MSPFPVEGGWRRKCARLICGHRAEEGDIFGTGCNTDGQLGLGAECLNDVYEIERKVVLPEKVVEEGGVSFIRAGADTSALITGEGNLWTWGNSVSRVSFSCL